MVKAVIYPSRIEISPYNPGDNKRLEKYLSVWDPILFKATVQVFNYNEKTKTLTIPRNTDEKCFGKEFLKNLEIEMALDYHDENNKVNFSMKNQPRDSIQAEGISFLLASDKYNEDFTVLQDENEKMLCLATGKGKTYSVINYLSTSQQTGVIIVDQDTLMKQWNSELLNHTNLNKEDIFVISGLDTIKMLLKAPSKLPFKVYLGSHRTFSTLLKKPNGSKILNLLFNKLGIGVKIFDEAHVEWKNIMNINFCVDTKETVYLTATPKRSNIDEDKIYQNVFGQVPKYGQQFHNDDDEKYQDIVFVEYTTNPSLKDKAEMKDKRGFNLKKYSDYIRDRHFDDIFEIVKEIINSHPDSSKIAIICHKNDFVDKLATSLESEYVNRTIGRFCGLISNKTKREEQKFKDIVVSTDRSLNKGIDIPGLEVVMVLNQYSSKVLSYQMAGRLRKEGDKPCTFYDFTDVGFEQCVEQRKYRRSGVVVKSKSISTKQFF